MTANEAELLEKCLRYRSILVDLLKTLPDEKPLSQVRINALSILAEDYGREGRCLFDPDWK